MENKGYVSERMCFYIILLCWLSYFCAYIGRANYNACIVDIVSTTGATNAQAGLVSSFFYISYGFGQIVNGILSRKANSIKMIGGALFASAIINLLMPSVNNIDIMKYLWFVNGLVQSALWPNIIKIYSDILIKSVISKAVVAIHTVGASGTAAVYGITYVFIKYFNWKGTFFFGAIILFLMAVVWMLGMKYINNHRSPIVSSLDSTDISADMKTANDNGNAISNGIDIGWKEMFKILAISGVLFAFLASIANGALRDGIVMWMPTYVHSMFDISSAFSVFITMILPIMQIFGAFTAGFARKMIDNHFYNTAIFYLVAFISLFILNTSKSISLPLTCMLFALIATMMTAVNTMLVSFIPLSMRRYNCSSVIAGITNSFVYVGSALASYGLGAISDIYGWNTVTVVLAIGTLGVIILCVAGGVKWHKFE